MLIKYKKYKKGADKTRETLNRILEASLTLEDLEKDNKYQLIRSKREDNDDWYEIVIFKNVIFEGQETYNHVWGRYKFKYKNKDSIEELSLFDEDLNYSWAIKYCS